MERWHCGWILFGALMGCGPAVSEATTTDDEAGSEAGTTATATATETSLGASATALSVTAGDTTATSGNVEPPPSLPESCECSEVPKDSECEGEPYVRCEGELLCPPLVTTCDRPQDFYGCTAQELTVDPDVMTCALDALVNRTPGRLELVAEVSPCFVGSCTDLFTDVAILDGDRAVEWVCEFQPHEGGGGRSSTTLRTLEAPAYFSDCRERPTTGLQYDCLLAGLVSDGSPACLDD